MDPKPRPNHRQTIDSLRRMTPDQRLMRSFELSRFTRAAFEEGLRRRFPDLPEDEFRAMLRRRLDLCHNRNY